MEVATGGCKTRPYRVNACAVSQLNSVTVFTKGCTLALNRSRRINVSSAVGELIQQGLYYFLESLSEGESGYSSTKGLPSSAATTILGVRGMLPRKRKPSLSQAFRLHRF